MRQSWEEANEAYDYALKAIEGLIRGQLLRSSKETWLSKAQDLPTRAAYALARTDDVRGAVEFIERGRAQLLSEALERNRSDLERLSKLGYEEVYLGYKEASAGWRQAGIREKGALELPARTILGDVDIQQAARAKLDTAIDAIRKVPGYEEFLLPPSYEQIAFAARDAPLVYLIATPAGGLALIVLASDAENPTVLPVWLEALSDKLLREKLFEGSDTETVGGYLGCYLRRRENNQAWIRWQTVLEETTGWLWEVLMGTLIEAMRPHLDIPSSEHSIAPLVTLIPTGLLGILPLHAAWTADVFKTGGRRYALDDIAFRYAPNARTIRAALALAQEIEPDRLLLFVDPQRHDAPELLAANDEARAILSYWTIEKRRTRWKAAATHQALKGDLLSGCTVFHFAGHAVAGWNDPAQGGLFLANTGHESAGDQRFTIRELQAMRLKLRLAILSACETGVPGLKLPEEVIGLPAALAESGVAGVVGSLWSVADESTAKLMAEFYRLWRVENLAPPHALHQAQITFRNRGQDIYHWGAFSYTGV